MELQMVGTATIKTPSLHEPAVRGMILFHRRNLQNTDDD
jgi:hypothetical protein